MIIEFDHWFGIVFTLDHVFTCAQMELKRNISRGRVISSVWKERGQNFDFSTRGFWTREINAGKEEEEAKEEVSKWKSHTDRRHPEFHRCSNPGLVSFFIYK